MAAQTWLTLQTECLAITAKAQPPYSMQPADFTQHFPFATAYAEDRIYRKMPWLTMRGQDTTKQATSGSRNVTLPAGMLVVETVSLLSPAASTLASGTQYAYDKATLEFIDTMWPSQATTMAPAAAEWAGRWWAPLDAANIVLAPTPDAAYTAVITGLTMPAPISAGTPSTYLSTNYGSLMIAGIMVFLAGAMLHNYGAKSGNPEMALSWEAEFQALLSGALDEEMRRRGMMPNVPMPSMPGGPK